MQDTKSKTNVMNDVQIANEKARTAIANAEQSAQDAIAELLSDVVNKNAPTKTELDALVILAQQGKTFCDRRDLKKQKFWSELPDGEREDHSHGKAGIWKNLLGRKKQFGLHVTTKDGISVITIPDLKMREKAARTIKAYRS